MITDPDVIAVSSCIMGQLFTLIKGVHRVEDLRVAGKFDVATYRVGDNVIRIDIKDSKEKGGKG